VLDEILATQISPELVPGDAEDAPHQSSEDVVGPYELQDFHLYQILRYGYAPTKVAFLKAYARAHPRRMGRRDEIPRGRTIMLHLPDLGNSERNAQLDSLLQEFGRRLIAILQDEK
jgi:NAD+ synthase (glutamine-hydrolysing)